MEEEFSFVVLLGLLLFFIWWSSRKSATQAAASTSASPVPVLETFDEAPVPMDVIQAVIEKFQSSQEDMVPIETLYFKSLPEGYAARIMFFNTRHYFGQQIDLNASISPSGDVVISNMVTTSDPVSYVNSYKPDTYQDYSNIDSNIEEQIKTALAATRGTKFTDDLTASFGTSFNGRLSQSDLMTRASVDTEKINF